MATLSLLREGLTRYGDGVLVDGLAESYEHNDDFTKWTFHLRESGWNNGEPVTADDWVYIIGAMLDGTQPLAYADFLYEIKNAREVYTKEKDVSELGVIAVDEKTVVFELAYPVAYFPYLITHCMHFGFDREYSDQVGIDNLGTEAQYTLCNGPFYIESWEHDNKLVFKKNPYYWNKDNIKIDQVNVYVIPDKATQVNLFLRDFGSYVFRVVSKLDLDEFLKTDHARKALSQDPENVFLKHPAGETAEDYQSVISKTKWNDPSQEVRADKNFVLSVDASVNPLKGKLRNQG